MRGTSTPRACGRCRQKHLKCDEGRPACQTCIATGVSCPGYGSARRFIDEGASLKRRYGRRASVAKPVTSNPNTLSKSTSIADGANGVSQRQLERPYGQDEELSIHPALTLSSPQISSPAAGPESASNEIPNNTWSPGKGAPLASLATTLWAPTATAAAAAPATTTTAHELPLQYDFSDTISEYLIGNDREMAFLIRHYTDVIGPWLDLSGVDKFYSMHVPVKALDRPLLRYAMAAIAAKQLGRVKGVKFSNQRGRTQPATMETYPNAHQVDWFYKAANYYFHTLSYLRQDLPEEWPSSTDPRCHGENSKCLETGGINWGEIIVASSILSLYEFLDRSDDEWMKHLDGTRSLILAMKRSINPVHQPSVVGTMDDRPFEPATRAALWNFVREDYLASYIHESPTRLDPNDNLLWRAAGLPLDADGQIAWKQIQAENNKSCRSPEELMVRVLNWLIYKLMNALYLQANHSNPVHSDGVTPSSSSSQAWDTNIVNADGGKSSSSRNLKSAQWRVLQDLMNQWISHLPDTFRPCAQIETHTFSAFSSSDVFPEIYYSSPLCGAAMQHYYFAQLLLLLHMPSEKPIELLNPQARVREHRRVTREIDRCCSYICGIAVGRPDDAARIHMVQPLFLSGQCVDDMAKRTVIIQLLRGIEADLGWETENKVKQLFKIWESVEEI